MAHAGGATHLTIDVLDNCRAGNASACVPQKLHGDVSRGLCQKLGTELTLRRISDAAIAEHEGPAPVRPLLDLNFAVRFVI